MDFMGPILGFISAWGLFELTELRKRRLLRLGLRRALKTELKAVEAILSITLIRFSFGTPDPQRGVKEFRWFVSHRHEFKSLADFPDFKMNWQEKNDEEIAALFKVFSFPGGKVTLEVSVPILDGILSSAEGSGLSADEIEALSNFRWQIRLLNHEHSSVKDFLPMTFTVTDPTNHKIIVENIQQARESYRTRLGHVLDYLRIALRMLDP